MVVKNTKANGDRLASPEIIEQGQADNKRAQSHICLSLLRDRGHLQVMEFRVRRATRNYAGYSEKGKERGCDPLLPRRSRRSIPSCKNALLHRLQAPSLCELKLDLTTVS